VASCHSVPGGGVTKDADGGRERRTMTRISEASRLREGRKLCAARAKKPNCPRKGQKENQAGVGFN